MVSKQDVARAISQIKRVADYEHFFSSLTSPEWIEPLAAAGFFKSPYEPVREGDLIQFPEWPESRYLARMAGLDPEAVLKTSLAIPLTDNIRVHEDLITVALSLPPPLAVILVRSEVKWIGAHDWLYSPLGNRYGHLIPYLTRGGELGCAIELATALLGPVEASVDAITVSARSRPRFELYEYEMVLKEDLSACLAVDWKRIIDLLCGLLEKAVGSRAKTGNVDEIDDLSHIWRPEIGDSEQNQEGTLVDALISTLRDSALSVVRGDNERMKEVLGILEHPSRCPQVRYRIGLHVLSMIPERPYDITMQHIMDRRLLWCLGVQNEYLSLVRQQFARLRKADQETWLRVVAEEPVISGGITLSTRDSLVARREKLAAVADVLPKEWREEHWPLVEGLFVPETFRTVSMYSFVGTRSPKNPEEIKGMSIPELVSFLEEWTASPGWDVPSSEGLGERLESAVSENPERYASSAMQFAELKPTYVQAVLSGFKSAAESGRSFEWSEVLQLSTWVLGRGEAGRLEGDTVDADRSWRWARNIIAELVRVGVSERPHGIPIDLRVPTWSIIETLAFDNDPSQEDEERYGGTNMDPVTLALNTVRGRAMLAILEYSEWVRRSDSEVLSCWPGLDAVPEVKRVLETKLDPINEPSKAVHACFGWQLGRLFRLDREWVEKHRNQIFDPRAEAYRRAAWDAFVVFHQPHSVFLDLLREEYRYYIGGTKEPTDSSPSLVADPKKRLGEHVALYFTRGTLLLGAEDQLVELFFTNAPDYVRGHTMRFIGRVLRNSDPGVPTDVIERLRSLWEWRAKEAGRGELASSEDEMTSFGWWLSSERFESAWALEKAVTVLKQWKSLKPSHLVLESLGRTVERHGRESLECLRLLIKGDKKGWEVRHRIHEVREIIKKAIASGDKEDRKRAVELINEFGAMGLKGYETLLPGGSAR